MEKTLLKGLRLIEALARSDGPRGVTDLAKQLSLTKSNIHRLLKTLQSRDYLRQVESTGNYDLSLKLWELGSLVLSRLDIKNIAASHLEKLADHSRETVHLSILDDREVVYIDKIDSPEPVRAYSRLGGRAPAYCVATGKALLAFAPETTINSIIRSLIPFTPRTIRTETAFRAELDKIRVAGWAINRGEWRPTVGGVAAPIRDASGAVIAAVGISGPLERLKPSRMKDLTPAVVATSSAISAGLGYMPPRRAHGTTARMSALRG
jgi:DNA-binding IclR family transcriptional regulator